MAEPQTFNVRAGLPFSKRIVITDGVTLWGTVEAFEARMQIRVEPDYLSSLKYDFTPHLVKAIEANNIVISWDLTGEETRSVKSGFFDLLLSDPGEVDTRAVLVLEGRINVRPVVTTGAP